MKLNTRDAAAFLKAPRDGVVCVLLFGPEAMRTAITRQDLLKTVLGANAEEDMRLTRMTGAELRSDGAALQDAMKAIGFFPGRRGVLVTDAGDGLAKVVADALDAAAPEDAFLVIEAGNLGKGSKLRKVVEGAGNAAAIGIYANPPSRGDIADQIKAAGLSADNDAETALYELAAATDPGDFRQLLQKAVLYTNGAPLTAEDVAAIAPASTEQAVDDVIGSLGDGNVRAIGPELHRLAAQGVAPITLCIAATRHFRQLHVAASDPAGPDSGIGRLRPPIFGPRRDRMARQARNWGMNRLEDALSTLHDTDLALRSSANHPAMAVMERAFIRIAMMSKAR